MSEATKPQFGCPKCKSTEISEINIVDVLLPVTEWGEDGEPAAFGSWSIVEGTISTKRGSEIIYESVPRFHCDSCEEEFNTPERVS